jgi:hypothetical protein
VSNLTDASTRVIFERSGNPDPLANIKLMRRFFDQYPAYADKVVLSVKCGLQIDIVSRFICPAKVIDERDELTDNVWRTSRTRPPSGPTSRRQSTSSRP